MKKFILLALLSFVTQALFENSSTIKSVNKMQGFQKILESDFVSMVFFYIEDCEDCQIATGLIEKVAQDQEGIINIYAINCDKINKDPNSMNKIPQCSEDMPDELPQISFFEPPKFKIKPDTKEPMIATEHRFQGEATPSSLGNFGHKLIPNNVIRIKTLNQLKHFETTDPKLNKVILFTKKKETSSILKSLNLHYFERVKFGEILASPETQSLLDEFDVKEIPYIIGLKNNGDNTYNREIFDGDLQFTPIKKFVRSLASKDRVPYEENKQNKKSKDDL